MAANGPFKSAQANGCIRFLTGWDTKDNNDKVFYQPIADEDDLKRWIDGTIYRIGKLIKEKKISQNDLELNFPNLYLIYACWNGKGNLEVTKGLHERFASVFGYCSHFTAKHRNGSNLHFYVLEDKYNSVSAVSEANGNILIFRTDAKESDLKIFKNQIAKYKNLDMTQDTFDQDNFDTSMSLDDSLQYLRDRNVRVDPVIEHVLPDRYNAYQANMNDSYDAFAESSTDCSCGLHFQETNRAAQRDQLGVIAAQPRSVLWKDGSTLKYHIADSVPEEHVKILQAALTVGIIVWGKILTNITIEQTFDSSQATHLVQVRDLSKEFGASVAAYGEFPEPGEQKHLVISTKVLVAPQTSRLLSRFIHEMGHNMGFYHEFAAGNSGIRVGKKSPLSIMGYESDRVVTQTDMMSFSFIYKYPNGHVVQSNPEIIIDKIAPYAGAASDNMDIVDVWDSLVDTLGSPGFSLGMKVVGFFGRKLLDRLGRSRRLPSVEKAVKLAAHLMDAAADALDMRLDENMDADVDSQAKQIAEKVANITAKAECSTTSFTALKEGIAGYSPREIMASSLWLNQLITQAAAIAIIKLQKGMPATLAGKTYKGGMPPPFTPDYTSLCAELHFQALKELEAMGTVGTESEATFQRYYRTRSTQHDLRDTIIADALSTTFDYLSGDIINVMKSTLDSAIKSLTNMETSESESKQACAYGFTTGSSGEGDLKICRITFYRVKSSAKQWSSYRKNRVCGETKKTGVSVDYELFYKSVTYIPEIVVPAYRADIAGKSTMLASYAAQKNAGVAALLGLEPDMVSQKTTETLKAEQDSNSSEPDVSLLMDTL